MNRYTATGFLTADPELRQLPSGDAVCNMRLAVKGMAPGYETGYINIGAFGKDAENCQKYLRKGSQIGVDGRLEHRMGAGHVRAVGHFRLLERPQHGGHGG